jgi:hypothetical protein
MPARLFAPTCAWIYWSARGAVVGVLIRRAVRMGSPFVLKFARRNYQWKPVVRFAARHSAIWLGGFRTKPALIFFEQPI